jgi:quercetin dioxygenase-like cupin family protein
MQTKSIATACLFSLSLGCAQLVGASATLADDAHHTVVAGDAITWGPAPPSLPKGAQAAILHGNPAQEGPFVLRLKLPDGFTVPPHRHSKDEFVTVISGKFAVHAGDKVDRGAAKPLPPASFAHLPAGMAHYAIADGEAVVQVNGFGPFDVKYVDPKDDPRLK